MKSGVQPWIGWGSQAGVAHRRGIARRRRSWAMPLPMSWALAGSLRMILVSGRSLRSTRAIARHRAARAVAA